MTKQSIFIGHISYYYSLLRRPLGVSSLDYKSMSRNLRRYTNAKYPSNPTSLSNIVEAYACPETMQKYGYNLRNSERFYICTMEASKGGYTIFASCEIMQMIDDFIPPEDRKYMLDGTFDVAPLGIFYQLLVIAIDYKKDVRRY